MNFQETPEVTREQFLMGKSEQNFCISRGMGEDGKEPATFDFLTWPTGRWVSKIWGYIYNRVNLETNKMPNNRGLVK